MIINGISYRLYFEKHKIRANDAIKFKDRVRVKLTIVLIPEV